MSFLTKPIPRSLRFLHTSSSRPLTSSTPVRSFHHSSSVAALSESDHSRDDGEKRHEEIDYHKHDQLRKQKDGKGHWVKELSSNSEAAIKADREEIDSAAKDIETLQKETVDGLKGKEK